MATKKEPIQYTNRLIQTLLMYNTIPKVFKMKVLFSSALRAKNVKLNLQFYTKVYNLNKKLLSTLEKLYTYIIYTPINIFLYL